MDLNKMHPADRLDYVLEAIRGLSWEQELNNDELYNAVVHRGDTWTVEGLIQVVNKLRKDGFVKAEPVFKSGTAHWHYSVTFDGVALLDLEGGHIGVRNRTLADKIRIDQNEEAVRQLEKKSLALQQSLRFLTGVASVVAVLLFVLESWKFVKDYYYPLFPFGGR